MCISARWSTSSDAHHFLHRSAWLRGGPCNFVVLQATNWKKKTLPIGKERWFNGKNANNHKKLLMSQSYMGYPHKARGRALAATDKVSECHTSRSILRYFFKFPLQGMHRICCHVSVFLIRPYPTHNNTLQVILKTSIFQFADPTFSLSIYLVKALLWPALQIYNNMCCSLRIT